MPSDVIVLGGGIAGLVCAWKLAAAGRKVLLLEKNAHPGGVIKTDREGEWLLDIGPNSIGFHEGDDISEMIHALGLDDELVVHPIRKSDRYIWRRGMLRRVPVSPLHIFRKNAISRSTLTSAVWKMWQKRTISDHDISVGAYFSTCLGRRVVNDVIAPAMAGIYAADPFCLGMQSVMPRLHEASLGTTSLGGALRKVKKINAATAMPGGRRVLASFRSGMGNLSKAIVDHAKQAGAQVLTGFEAVQLNPVEDGQWQVVAADGRVDKASQLVCALPSEPAKMLLDPVAPDAAALLGSVHYAPMVIAHVGVKENDVGVNLPGFGYLAVRDSGVRSLGMIWNDRMFPNRAPAGHRLFTVFLGGQIDRDVLQFTDDQLLDIIRHDLQVTMQWRGPDLAMHRITRLPAAIPIMEVGHADRVRAVRAMLPPALHLTGNYVAGVSVPSCMRAGALMAESLGRSYGNF